jgi:23S rRNA pseudouridine1911/1915/1917 synthase
VLARKDGFSFVEAEPRTGRTHQIRVHFKAIGYPIVSDTLYASTRPLALGFTRAALHARSLAFRGRGGKEVSAIAPYPADFENAISLITTGK